MQTWVLSSNLRQYDVVNAFREFDEIDWTQSANFEVGDIVYVYVSHPVMEIHFKCIVQLINLETRDSKDHEFVHEKNSYEGKSRYMRLKLLSTFEEPIPFKLLSDNGLNGRIQGPRKLFGNLLEFINTYEEPTFKYEISIREDNKLNECIQKSLIKNYKTTKYVPKPMIRPLPRLISGVKIYPRNREVAINALKRANFKCECGAEHPTFISKWNGLPYMEAHHLIPLAYQDDFEYSLDVEANIVALCSHCHNEIHYGSSVSGKLKSLFSHRRIELELAGIFKPIDLLLEYYKH